MKKYSLFKKASIAGFAAVLSTGMMAGCNNSDTNKTSTADTTKTQTIDTLHTMDTTQLMINDTGSKMNLRQNSGDTGQKRGVQTPPPR